MELLERSQIKKEDTWDLESMYANDTLWEKDFAQVENALAGLSAHKGEIAKDLSVLAAVMEENYAVERIYENLAVYAKMRLDQDTANAYYQSMCTRARQLGTRLSASVSYIDAEILSHPRSEVETAINQVPGLVAYRRNIEEILRGAEHTKDAATEELLANAGELASVPHNIYSLFTDADLTFPDAVLADGTKISVTNANFVTNLESDDRNLRKAVFEAYYNGIGAFGHSIAAMMEANVRQAVFFAGARDFSSSRAMYLHGSNIPESVYDSLIEAVHENMDAMYRYVGLRKKILGVDELHMYDVYTQLFEAGGRRYSIEEAKAIVKEGLAPLGKEYTDLLQEGFDSRWIDIYPNKGKRGGAYSWGTYDSQPFVLLNYQGTLDNVFTLAHEMGHSLHSWYSKHTQPFQTADYRIFVAEVASTCNEALLIQHLLKKTDDPAERRYLLNHFLDTFKGTLFRQTMFAEFERDIHRMSSEGTPLTADVLNAHYLELNRQYFGPEMVSDELIGREWMRIPHFYTPFYVYQYATGFSAAIALSRRILSEGAPAVEDYKKFLRGGSSMDPIDLLKLAGVDMTQKAPVASALAMFDELVRELEALV